MMTIEGLAEITGDAGTALEAAQAPQTARLVVGAGTHRRGVLGRAPDVPDEGVRTPWMRIRGGRSSCITP